MTSLLNDLSYIPPNNEYNEPTQEVIGETSNEPTQVTCNEFEELYNSANKELYPGCDYVIRLDFMAKFTYFKVKGKLSDSIFNEMLEFFPNVFPISKAYKLPPSYYAIKKTFKTIGLGYESIHACENDCCLFRGDDNKDLDFCLVCNTSRWKDSNIPGKKAPKKVLRYFLIIPRLQPLYKSSHTAKEMIWHATEKCTKPDKMQHPVDGIAWKKFDTKYPDFAKEPRNVRLGLGADGFNPFSNLSQAYSMWPVILTTYNIPPWLCMKESSFMLTLLIPGPKSPGKDIDVYLRPLIEDLKELEYWSFLSLRHNLDIMHIEKNMLEDILNTLLMNDKSKDTAKARQDLERLGIRSGLWLGQTKNKKCLKPQNAYSFTPENRKKFCQFIKNVKLPDGFESCFKHKVTDNDTNIMGLKSHDCHIMMQRLLPYGLQQYLPKKIAKPIIELYSLFKQICSVTLMDDDMLKAQIKVVDILCYLELIYPPALFDIMIHLVFQSVCKLFGLRSVIRFDAQELKIVKWYVLYNSPEIDKYWSQFKRWSTTEVDAPPDINDVVDEDGDIIDDEDALSRDLADSDDEDLINVDDDGVDKMSAYVARSHGSDGGGKDRPLPYYVPTGKGKRKPNLGGRAAGRLNTHDKTQNLSLKEITDTKGLIPIRFEVRDKQTLMPLGEHAAHWSSYIREVIRGVPLYNPSWLKVPKERKATLIADIRTQFDLKAAHGIPRLDRDPRQYPAALAKSEEMRRLDATSTYTDVEINRLARGGKQRGHIPGVGMVLPARVTASPLKRMITTEYAMSWVGLYVAGASLACTLAMAATALRTTREPRTI
nr:hypothetical protein [Tanacetum cinerariifolium]